MTTSVPTKPEARYDLTQSPLYNLRSKRKLASLLFLSIQELIRLSTAPDLYRKFPVFKDGKERQVETPSWQLLPVHTRLFALLKKIELPDYLHSSVKGRSYVTNAKVHLGQKEAYTLDIKKFYQSVTRSMVARFFRDTMRCEKDVGAILANLTTCDDHVPTGSPISQLLAFLACMGMFEKLYSLGLKEGLKFSCYVDDVTFSGDKITKKWVHEKVKAVIRKAGLRSHKDKHFRVGQIKMITGVIVDGSEIKVCNRMHESIYKLITQLSETSDLKVMEATYNTLIGKLSAAGQIEQRFKDQRVKVRDCRRRHRLSLRPKIKKKGHKPTMTQTVQMPEASLLNNK